MTTTYADLVLRRAGDEKVGLRFEDRSWTWAQVIEEASVRAAAIVERVPEPDGRQRHVGILLDNVPDYVFWLLAGALSGTTIVGLNSSRPADELRADIVQGDVDFIVSEDRHMGTLLTIEQLAIEAVSIDSPEYRDWLESHHGSPVPRTPVNPEHLALLLFSSGTTGTPKAVIVSQKRLGALGVTLKDRIELRRDSVTYLCMPLFHGNAVMMNLVPAVVVGATVALTRKFTASRFSEEIHRFGATYVNYVGRALSYVLNHPEDPRDAEGSLELAYGTEASEADIERFGTRFGCRVVEGYGLTEGVFRIGRTPDTPHGALGRPQEGLDIRVLNEETGEECPRAEFDSAGRMITPEAVGQMVAIGRADAFEGYYKNPEAEAERIRGDDFWSGDLAYRDQEGWFYFAGRSSDWIRVDGENFAAAQVERVIERFPGVASAPVFAIPDPRTGDQVMVVIELEPGADFDVGAFGEFLEKEESFGVKWWPQHIRIVSELPLTGSGKVDKAPLRRVAWHGEGEQYVRRGRTAEYLPFTAQMAAELEQEFLTHDRGAHIPFLPQDV